MPSFKELTISTIGGIFTIMGGINASTHDGTPGLVSMGNWILKISPGWLDWVGDFMIIVGNNFVYAVGITIVGILLLMRRSAIFQYAKRLIPGAK